MEENFSEVMIKPRKKNHGGIKHKEPKIPVQDNLELISTAVVRIPCKMHIGAECEPLVKAGDRVFAGQVIADSAAFVSSPIHASISGTVKAIHQNDEQHSGSSLKSIEIVSDGQMTLDSALKIPEIHSEKDFLQAVRQSGLVGLGGAGFPTHVKLSVEDGSVDTLIANGCECEPFISVDDYRMQHDTQDILDAMAATLKWLKIKRAYLAIEDNKKEAAQCLANLIAQNPEKYGQIKVMIIPSAYPKGMEKIVIYNVTGRTVPEGKLPKDVGCIVMNTTTLAELGKYLRTGIPLIRKVVTVAGSALEQPRNVIVPIGTLIDDLLQAVGIKEDPDIVTMGGPMMGLTVATMTDPVLKQNNAILALTEDDVQFSAETQCIRCAKCVNACPMQLEPTGLVKMVKKKKFAELTDNGILTCMECGCCDFVCPAKIPLLQYIRYGKMKVR